MLRAPLPGLAAGERRLDGPLAHYLGRVLRLRAGDAFVAFDPATGAETDGTVVRGDGATLTVLLGALREGGVRARRSVTWIQGLPKGEKADAVVRDATELGATRIAIAPAHRSVVRLEGARAVERTARWTRIAQEAARQCGRSDSPGVALPASWIEALGLAGDDAARFCLWEAATDPLGPNLLDALSRKVPIVFACGPEGGLEKSEVEAARAAGWSIVSLGPFALRTETVAAATLGAVRVLEGFV